MVTRDSIIDLARSVGWAVAAEDGYGLKITERPKLLGGVRAFDLEWRLHKRERGFFKVSARRIRLVSQALGIAGIKHQIRVYSGGRLLIYVPANQPYKTEKG